MTVTKEQIDDLVSSCRESTNDAFWSRIIVALADQRAELVAALMERMGGYRTTDDAVAADIRHEALIARVGVTP